MHGADTIHLKRNNFYLRALQYNRKFEEFEFTDLLQLEPNIPGLDVIRTPGHSVGSCSFKFKDVIATGDALLPRNIGSPTVPGSDLGQQINSVERMLALIEPQHLILPGHGKEKSFSQLLELNEDLQTLAQCSALDLKGD
jgi:glyoxylase-like metal-dependent hydrolase (beta-lactamase superfamily II)